MLSRLASVTGLQRFVLFGGHVVDSLIRPNAVPRDIDIGVVGYDRVNAVASALARAGYVLEENGREYQVNQGSRVVLVLAKNDTEVLDVSFVESLESLGQFSIESMFVTFPECQLVDRYGGWRALAEGRIEPNHGYDRENPFLLLSRVMVLASKYDIPLRAQAPLIAELNRRIAAWTQITSFHETTVLPSYYAKSLKAVADAQNMTKVEAMLDSQVFSAGFVELHRGMLDLCQQQRCGDLLESQTEVDVARLLSRSLNAGCLDAWYDKLISLKHRPWSASCLQISAEASRESHEHSESQT